MKLAGASRRNKVMVPKRKRVLVRTQHKTSSEWKWLGFSKKTLWDWMQLLIIPVILIVVAYLFTSQQHQTDSASANVSGTGEGKSREEDCNLVFPPGVQPD